MKKIQHIYHLLTILALGLSCANIQKRPMPEVRDFIFPIKNNGTRIFSKYDHAHAKDFDVHIQQIKRISIQYNLRSGTGSDPDLKGKDDMDALWQTEIEKNLLRRGYVVTEDKLKNEIIDGITIELDEQKNTTKDKTTAVLIIDAIHIQKITNSYLFSLDKNKQAKNSYAYSYYLADMRGKIMLNNKDIIWCSSITASSFDMLKQKEKKVPSIYIKAIRDYNFSEKQTKWIPGNWLLDSSSDNFQMAFSSFNEKFHKRELIDFVVGSFFDLLKTENGGK